MMTRTKSEEWDATRLWENQEAIREALRVSIEIQEWLLEQQSPMRSKQLLDETKSLYDKLAWK